MSEAGGDGKQGPGLISPLLALLPILASVYGGPLLKLPWWGQLAIDLPVIVLVFALFFRRRLPAVIDFLRRPSAAAGWAGFGILGIAIALVTSFAATPVLSQVSASCEPIDLRVVTGPENVAPLTEAAHRYVADKSGEGCPAADIDVTANSSIDALEEGFADGWTSPGSGLTRDCSKLPERVTLLGPRPDVWIPDSTLVAEKVQQDLGPEHACDLNENPVAVQAKLTARGSIASSPVVLGVFEQANNPGPDSDPGKQSLSSLLQSFKNRQVLNSVSRPSPDTAQSGLLATPLLHLALRAPGWNATNPQDAERLIDTSAKSSGIPTGDTASLLCGFREDDAAGKTPPNSTAVILPESSLARYDNGSELADESACPIRQPSHTWQLYPFYTGDLPVLDFPFVQVRWPGEDTARRNRAVGDFLGWLKHDQLAQEGFRTVSGPLPDGDSPLTHLPNADTVPGSMRPHPLRGDPGCVGSLDQVLDCYDRSRPADAVNLLLDISGSMGSPVAPTGPRLLRAQQLAQRVVSGIRPQTPMSLLRFSDVTRPTAEPYNPDATPGHDAVLADIQQTDATNGPDLPLTTAIEQTLGKVRLGKQTLVVLTDGQSTATNPDYAGGAHELAARIQDQNPGLRVLIVLTGPTSCRDQPVATIVATLGTRGSCVDKPPAVDDLARAATFEIFWGGSA